MLFLADKFDENMTGFLLIVLQQLCDGTANSLIVNKKAVGLMAQLSAG